MARREPRELLRNPMSFEKSAPEPPVSKAMGLLAVTEGPNLEILTRTNAAVVSAIDAGTVFVYRYRSAYIADRIQQIERLAIASGGLARREMIDTVQAGGQMPDSFYDGSSDRVTDYAVED